jgi:hypothetical protein
MSTPSIQTLITQAQQVLNLKSSNEIRATLAAILANANVGTPLNPNLTTQQLWDEFYEIVRQPSDDIMSIITDQMMRMVFSPPAPGGAGADKQVIFNDGGVLAGDTKFLWDKNANRLDVDGPVVITGAATVATNVLVANAAGYTGKVGIGTATPGETLDVKGTGNFNNTSGTYLGFQTNAAQVGYIGTANTILTGGLNTELGLYANSSLVIATGASALQRLRVEAAGDVKIVTGNVVIGTSGKGIDFAATANPISPIIMTSELLNDYEEGTFEPTVKGTTAAGTASYSRRLGRYTKVGNLVTIQIYLAWSAGAGGLGNLAFIGLPFNIANNANEYAVATIGFLDSVALTALNTPTIIGAANSTMLEMWQFPVGGGVSSQVPYDADGSIILTSTYVAA